MRRNLILICLDGADPKILKRRGMEFLDRINIRGAAGTTRTGSRDERGWATIFTGQGAGGHGGFYWPPTPGGRTVTDKFNLMRSKAEPLWLTLDKHGVSQGWLAVPATYPPPALKNGFFVSGWGGGVRPKLEDCAWPDDFIRRNKDLFANYIHDVRPETHARLKPERMALDLARAAKLRMKAAFRLMERYSPRVFATAFVGLDRLLHYFFPLASTPDHGQNTALSRAIDDYFARLDKVLCAFIDRFADKSDILFLSDHGFEPRKYLLRPNRVLLDHGMAAAAPPSPGSLKRSMKRTAVRILPRFAVDFYRAKFSANLIPPPPFDWNKTLAFCNMASGLFINLKSRYGDGAVDDSDYESTRERIIQTFSGAPNPLGTGPLFTRVARREEVFQGELAGLAPDVLLFGPDQADIDNGLGPVMEKRPEPEPNPRVLPRTVSGIHGPDGFFAAVGPGASRMKTPDRARDVRNLILELCGLERAQDQKQGRDPGK